MADATQTSTLKKVLRRLKPHTFAIVLSLISGGHVFVYPGSHRPGH